MIYEVFGFKNDFPFKYTKQIRSSDGAAYFHWHEEIELIYVTDGCGYGFNDSVKTYLEKGDILVVNSGEIHTFGSDNEMTYQCIIINEGFLRKNGIDITKTLFCHHIRNEKMAEIFEEMYKISEAQTDYKELRLKTDLLRLFCIMADKYIADISEKPYHNALIINGVKGAINYIHENFPKKITIDEIVDKSGFSRAYFSREFKKITGKSIVDYINFIRCTRADELISSGEYNIGKAAEICGFSNLSYFTKIYKKIMGRLPSELLKK